VSSIVIEDKVIAVIAWPVGLGVKSSNRRCVLSDNNTGATVYFSPMVSRQKQFRSLNFIQVMLFKSQN
jgi:hypothetical protein